MDDVAKFAVNVDYLWISSLAGSMLNLTVVCEKLELTQCQHHAWATPGFVRVKTKRDGRIAGC